MNINDNKKIPRRSFFKKIWVLLGLIAGAETLYLIFDFLSPRHRKGTKGNVIFIDAGDVDTFKNGSVTSFRKNSFYLVRLKNSGFIALSIKCTHLGCAIIWDEDKGEFICPCHSSRFDVRGKVHQPPATRPLDTHPVVIEGNRVKINTGRTIKRSGIDKAPVVFA